MNSPNPDDDLETNFNILTTSIKNKEKVSFIEWYNYLFKGFMSPGDQNTGHKIIRLYVESLKAYTDSETVDYYIKNMCRILRYLDQYHVRLHFGKSLEEISEYVIKNQDQTLIEIKNDISMGYKK